MPKYQAPAGTIVRGWAVALEPSPEQAATFRRDCGARRYAYNWAVTAISGSFGAGRETGDYDSAVWSAYSLRKRWNQIKGETAPWWAERGRRPRRAHRPAGGGAPSRGQPSRELPGRRQLVRAPAAD
jgi:hypothetical protein